MSGLIYNQKMTSDLTPDAPDSKPQQVIQQQAQNIQDTVKKQKEEQAKLDLKQQEWETKEKQKDVDWFNNTTKSAILQVYKNAKTLYPDDYKKYQELVGKGVKDIWASMPDSKDKVKMMAEIQIESSGYDATVQKGEADFKGKKHNSGIATYNIEVLDASISGLSSLFVSSDNNLSPFQQKNIQDKFVNSMIGIKKVYDQVDALDVNGNRIYTHAEKTYIKDKYENAGKYAVIEYTSQNIEGNRQGVVNTYNYLKNNRNEVIKQYSMDTKEYDATLKDMKAIIDGESTAERIRTEGMFKNEIDFINTEADSGKDITKSLFETINKMEEAYPQRLIGDSFYINNISKLKSDFYERTANKNKVFKRDGMFGAETVGVALQGVVDSMYPSNLKDVKTQASKFDTMNVLVNLLEQSGIDINSAKAGDIIKAKEIMNKNKPKQMQTIYPSSDPKQLETPQGQELVVTQGKQKASEVKARKILDLGQGKFNK